MGLEETTRVIRKYFELTENENTLQYKRTTAILRESSVSLSAHVSKTDVNRPPKKRANSTKGKQKEGKDWSRNKVEKCKTVEKSITTKIDSFETLEISSTFRYPGDEQTFYKGPDNKHFRFYSSIWFPSMFFVSCFCCTLTKPKPKPNQNKTKQNKTKQKHL